jgi:hypothetical protein
MQKLYIVVMNSVFWEEMLCNLIEICLRFRETFCVHLQGRRVSQASSSLLLLAWLFSDDKSQYVHLKRGKLIPD